jgi:hypothetical protein
VLAAFKVIGTFLVACVSIIAAIMESNHPILFGGACAAFLLGIASAEGMRAYRNRTVRSSIHR